MFNLVTARLCGRSGLLFLRLPAWAEERVGKVGPVPGLWCDTAASLLDPELHGCSPRLGLAGKRTRSRLKPLPLESYRGVSETQIAWQTKGGGGVSKHWGLQSLPGQPLASKKNNGYFSAPFLYLHLSDGKLRPVLVHSFHRYLRNKKVIFTGADSMQPDLRVHRQWPRSARNTAFLPARTEVQDVTSASFSLELVTVWALMPPRTSWLSTFPSPSEERKRNNEPKWRKCFFQCLNWALPPTTFMLTTKPTLKRRRELTPAQFSTDKAESRTAASRRDLQIRFTQTVIARALNSVSVSSFRWRPTATRGESHAPTKHILCVFHCIPGYGDEDLKRKHVSCDPSEQENTTWILASWTQKELRWSLRYFQGLLALQLLWLTLGISRRYSRSNFLVDLDFTLDFSRTNDLRNYGAKSKCQKTQKK